MAYGYKLANDTVFSENTIQAYTALVFELIQGCAYRQNLSTIWWYALVERTIPCRKWL